MPTPMIDEDRILDNIKKYVKNEVLKKTEEEGIVEMRGSKIIPHIETSTATFYNHGGWYNVEQKISYIKYSGKPNGKIYINLEKARKEHGL